MERVRQRLEQEQHLDAEKRRKLLSDAEPMTAAEAVTLAEAEGLQLECSENNAGYRGVRLGPASAKTRPFQAVVGDTSLGYYATAEEAALVHARHTAPAKAADAARAAVRAEEAAEAAVRAEIRALRQKEKQAEADEQARLDRLPPRKPEALIKMARYAAFAKEFNTPGAEDSENYCCDFNLSPYGGCQLFECPCKHEVPPSFQRESWLAIHNQRYAWPAEGHYLNVLDDFWDGQMTSLLHRHGRGEDWMWEGMYEGRRFYWHYGNPSEMRITALRGTCPCRNNPQCVTCRHVAQKAAAKAAALEAQAIFGQGMRPPPPSGAMHEKVSPPLHPASSAGCGIRICVPLPQCMFKWHGLRCDSCEGNGGECAVIGYPGADDCGRG